MARVLITGCSVGIGRATAEELSARGHEVVATARRPESLEGLDVKERLQLDVTDDDSVAAVREAAGDVDALVNNAGLGLRAPVEDAPLDQVQRLFDTNVLGVVRMINAFVPPMRERGHGVVVNVSSVAGRIGLPLSGYYSATKFAVEGLSEALHYEISRFGVRVVVVEPGYIATDFGERSVKHAVEQGPYAPLFEQMSRADRQLLPGERPGPEIVAAAVADAVENDDTPLRVPVGVDAELATSTRSALADDEFEATMRRSLDLHW